MIAPPSTRGYFKNLDRTRRQGIELGAEARPWEALAVRGSLSLTRATFQTEASLASALVTDDDEGAGDDPAAGGEAAGADGVAVGPGDRFAMVPELVWTVWTSYSPAPWTLELEGSYVGEQYFVGDEDDTAEFGTLHPHFLVAGEVGREIGALRVFVRGENLLDAEHSTFGLISPNVRGPDTEPQPFLSPGLPRRVLAGVRYSF